MERKHRDLDRKAQGEGKEQEYLHCAHRHNRTKRLQVKNIESAGSILRRRLQCGGNHSGGLRVSGEQVDGSLSDLTG